MWVITFRSIPLKLVIMMDRGYAGSISNPSPKLSWSYSIRIRVQPRQELFFLSGPQSPSYLFLSYNASWVICCFDRRHLGIAGLSRRNWGKDAGQCESSDSGKS